MQLVVIVAHEDGSTKYFGPVDDVEISSLLKKLDQQFGYKNTPFTVCVTNLLEPLENHFFAFRKEKEK